MLIVTTLAPLTPDVSGVSREQRATLHVRGSADGGVFGDIVRDAGKLVDEAGRRATMTRLFHCSLPASPGDRPPARPEIHVFRSHAFSGRIHKRDAFSYDVDRTVLRELVSGPDNTDGLRIVPFMRDGKRLGVRVFGIRRASLPSELGLDNGDLVMAINGTRIDSLDAMLKVFAQLDLLHVVELEGERTGKPFAITLRLR